MPDQIDQMILRQMAKIGRPFPLSPGDRDVKRMIRRDLLRRWGEPWASDPIKAGDAVKLFEGLVTGDAALPSVTTAEKDAMAFNGYTLRRKRITKHLRLRLQNSVRILMRS